MLRRLLDRLGQWVKCEPSWAGAWDDDEPTPMCLDDLLATYRDGDEHGWKAEFDWLREHDAERLAELRADIAANGIREPVLIGSDGRIWDGHHRLCIAYDLGITEIPTTRDW